MKRTLFLTLVCFINMVAVSQNNVPWQNAKGNGTLASPWLIDNADQLDQLAGHVNNGTDYAGQYFALTAHIEANPGTIIGDSLTHPFRGCADGRGYSVTRQAGTASGETDGYQLDGLFGYLGDGAVITNFNIKGTIKAQGANSCRLFAGAIAAMVGEGAKVQNCTASATVSASGIDESQKAGSSYVGNLVGYNLGTVVNSTASGETAPVANLTTASYVGTAIGYNGYSGELFTAPFAVNGKASLPPDSIGEITVTLKDRTGKTIASSTGTAPLNYVLDKIHFWKDNVYSLEVSATGYPTVTLSPSFSGKTEDVQLFANATEGYKWYVPVAQGGTFDGSEYQIGTVLELQALAKLVNNEVPSATILNGCNSKSDFTGKTIRLTADLDLGSISSWTPIGITYKEERKFKGSFDGNGKTISNLSIPDSLPYSGLFGYIDMATIKNLTLHNVTIKNGYDGNNSGSFVGFDSSSQLSDLMVTGTLSIIASSENKSTSAGGIVGYAVNSCLIANCAVQPENTDGTTVHISATGTNTSGLSGAGGIAGNINGSESITTNCFNTANVEATHSGSSSYICAGGIAGYGHTQLSNCYASGNVSARVENAGTYCWIGGIVGYITAIHDCHAVGTAMTATGSNSQNAAGRVFGYKGSGTPTNIYANTAMTFNNGSFPSSGNNGTDMSALSSSPWWKPDGTQSMVDLLNASEPADGEIILENQYVRYTAKFRQWKVGDSAKKPAVFTTDTTQGSNL